MTDTNETESAMTQNTPADAEEAREWRPWPEDILDQYGYPTDEALDYIRSFYGTPEQLVEFMVALYRPGGGIIVDDDFDETWKKDVKKVRMITGGWSGCETAHGVLSDYTIFQYRFWESSHRGGLEVYEIRVDDWDKATFLGSYMPHPEADPHEGLNEGQLRFRLDRALRQARRHKRRAALANWDVLEHKSLLRKASERYETALGRIAELEAQLRSN